MTVTSIERSPVSFTLPPNANGILPDRMIAAMADAGLILPAYPFVESQIQPASLDLGSATSPIACARASCPVRARRSPSVSTN